jgi:hypothetical protein
MILRLDLFAKAERGGYEKIKFLELSKAWYYNDSFD